jgi:hypothetical protein
LWLVCRRFTKGLAYWQHEGEKGVREIINEAVATGSIVFTFDDTSVVWVVFQKDTAMNANSHALAKTTAYRFLKKLNPAGRWEGKIDGAGKILESPIKDV